jgi:hypothetical protein
MEVWAFGRMVLSFGLVYPNERPSIDRTIIAFPGTHAVACLYMGFNICKKGLFFYEFGAGGYLIVLVEGKDVHA